MIAAPARQFNAIAVLLLITSVPLCAMTFYLAALSYTFAIPLLLHHDAYLYWYFPGDPPYADISLICGVCAIAAFLAALAFFRAAGVFKSERTTGKAGYTHLLAVLAVMLAPTLLSFTVIASRHTGDMGQLKSKLSEYSRIIAADNSIDPSGRLKNGQWEDLESRYLTPAPLIKIAGLDHPVRIRIMSSSPPYVGADFRQGHNAQFNLTTMLCLYSD